MKKTILITGSTDGIGKLTAQLLANDGHEVYLHGRNQRKLDTIISEIKEQSNNEKVDGFVADFSDLEAVEKLANDIEETLPKLDVLINNAGVYHSSISVNEKSMDMRFMVNYLAPYTLTNKLIPTLTKSKKSRIINLSSAAQSPVSLEALTGSKQIPVSDSYAQSKLALTMWSFQLAKELKDSSVIAVNPGSLLNTRMVQEAFGTHWASADKGANILFDLAVSPEYANVTGKYFDNDQGSFGTAHPDAYDEYLTGKLIKATKDLIA